MRPLAFALLLAGCSYTLDPEGTACANDTDCAAGYACSAGHCHVAGGGTGGGSAAGGGATAGGGAATGGGGGGGSADAGADAGAQGLQVFFESIEGMSGGVYADAGILAGDGTFPVDADGGSITLTTSGPFVAWRGACHGTQPSCTVAKPLGASVVAVFGPPNYMFVTSRLVTGDFGGLDGGDDICNTSAADGGLPGSYTAWLSTMAESAVGRTSPGGWIRTDGRVFARGKADIFSAGLIEYPPRFDEHGVDVANEVQAAVFTGSDPLGSVAGAQDCNGWSSTTDMAAVGDSTGGSLRWSNSGQLPCSTPARLYCLRVVDVTSVTPPPLPYRLAFVTSMPGPPDLSAADAVCDNTFPGGTFRALMATSTHSAMERFDAGGLPWARIDDVQLFETPADAMNGTLLAPFERDADQFVVTGLAWLGATTLTGLPQAAENCADWSTVLSSQTGVVARLNSSAPDWVSDPVPCSGTYSVICLQQ